MKLFAKPLLWLLTTAIPVFIAACYGAPGYICGYGSDGDTDYDDDTDEPHVGHLQSFRGRVNAALTAVAIPFIRVTCGGLGMSGEEVVDKTYSKPDGSFELWHSDVVPCDFLRFEDVDGAFNGSFASKEVDFDNAIQDDVYELEAED